MPSDASPAALAALLRAGDDACRTRALDPSGKSARASALGAKGSPCLSGGRRHRYLARRNHRPARRWAAAQPSGRERKTKIEKKQNKTRGDPHEHKS
jgi:hypothetical protein